MTILASKDTRVLVQGITGREAATFVIESLQYGTNIVAGVTPGKGGTQVHGIPVYDTVQQAIQSHGGDATIISVPPRFVLDAAREALENGLRLLVIVTERIPRRDVSILLAYARQFNAQVIGPNSLGLISPAVIRLGMAGGSVEAVRRAYMAGSVGVLSRSGGMMTEIANMLTQANIGQSTCISIGGDPLVGSTFLDLLPLYEADPDTKALVLFCEPGGTAEESLAEYLQKHGTSLSIIAFVAGRFAEKMPGQRFGHAGAMVQGDKGNPRLKMSLLRESGVLVANQLSDLPHLVQSALDNRP
jgi:succinyl-CoA synthetase alpha subunit